MSKIIPIIEEITNKQREEEYGPNGKPKTSFWASESETMAFDIYHRWLGTHPTNPMSSEKRMMLKMRKFTEVAIVEILRQSGKIVEELTNETRMYFEYGEHKTPISGYPDTGIYFQEPNSKEVEKILIEIKTYYGDYQHREVANGKVKTAYLKQIFIYMYHFKVPRGILLMANQGTGEMFEYECFQNPSNPFHFTCVDNSVEVNLKEVFDRFEKIYVDNVLPKIEPAIEYQYKYDIEKLDWTALSADKIRKARTNKAVVGAWQVLYSDFKNMIVEKQGTCLGYSPAELKRIHELTDGYSVKTKKQNQVRFDPGLM